MTNNTTSSKRNSLVIIAALFVVAAGLKTAQDLVVPFLLSAFIATIAATPLFWLRDRGVNSSLALPLVIVGIVIALMMLGGLLASSTSAFAAKLPFYQERLLAVQADLVAVLNNFNIPLDLSSVVNSLSPASALTVAGSTLARVGTVLSDSLLITLTVIFILAEANSFPTKLKQVLHNPERDLPLFTRFTTNMNRYIAIKTSVSIATGVVVTAILWILNVDFPLLWGLLAMLLNFIPTIGSIIAAIPPVTLAIVQAGPATAGAVAASFFLINMVMGNMVEPRFMGRGLGLSTLVVFLSLVLWGWLLGPIGMLLSVPLTMTAKIALEANPETSWIAYLLGPAEPARADTDEQPSEQEQPPTATS
ncbi:MAG: AI-2E family transporter [Proteobacteria bacterium]|nr:AI-2E family transporter [Pseudomonadota bacterium]